MNRWTVITFGRQLFFCNRIIMEIDPLEYPKLFGDQSKVVAIDIHYCVFIYKKTYQIKQFHFLQFNLYSPLGYYNSNGLLYPIRVIGPNLFTIQLYIFAYCLLLHLVILRQLLFLRFFSILKNWRLVLPFVVKNKYILFKFVELCCQVLRLDYNLKECMPCLRGSFLKLDSWLLKYFCSMYRGAIVSFNVKRIDF